MKSGRNQEDLSKILWSQFNNQCSLSRHDWWLKVEERVLSPTQRSIIALAALQKSTTRISVITKQVHAHMVLVSKMCRLKLTSSQPRMYLRNFPSYYINIIIHNIKDLFRYCLFYWKLKTYCEKYYNKIFFKW